MRLQLTIIQKMRMELSNILELFGNESILSYTELRDRALNQNWHGNEFNNTLIDAQRSGLVKCFFDRFAGYFYEIDDMMLD